MPLRTEPIVFPDLASLDSGGLLQLPIDSIDEDPDQPRTEFDAEALEELASTIRSRGVLQPVSVRPHPRSPGRWMLNFGSRRYRASRLANRDVIPAFVDGSFDTYSQVIENEQREALQPMELALFVKKRRSLGETQSEIGRLLGKSQSYVAFASALIDPPDWMMGLYRSKKCRGLYELYQLRRLHERAPATVEAWCADQVGVSRSDVQRLATMLEERETGSAVGDAARVDDASAVPLQIVVDATNNEAKPPLKHSLTLIAEHAGHVVVILTREVPSEAGHVFVSGRDTGGRCSVAARDLTLIGFARAPGS